MGPASNSSAHSFGKSREVLNSGRGNNTFQLACPSSFLLHSTYLSTAGIRLIEIFAEILVGLFPATWAEGCENVAPESCVVLRAIWRLFRQLFSNIEAAE